MKKHIALAGLLIVMASTSGLYANCREIKASDRIYWYSLDGKTQRAIKELLNYPNWKECQTGGSMVATGGGTIISTTERLHDLQYILNEFRSTKCASQEKLFSMFRGSYIDEIGYNLCGEKFEKLIKQLHEYFLNKMEQSCKKNPEYSQHCKYLKRYKEEE